MDEHQYTDVPDRIVVIGDLHGHYDALVCILRHAKLIDNDLNWVGGDSWLIQMGDIFGRGHRAFNCTELLMNLQQQAPVAGGSVCCLLGNHEAMVTHRQLRYVPPAELENFAADFSSRSATESFLYAMREDQPIGGWLHDLPVVVKIGSILFVHADLDARWVSRGLHWLNLQAQLDMKLQCFYTDLPANSPILAPKGPLWSRRLALINNWQDPGADAIKSELECLDVRCLVIAHTPTCYMPACQPGSIVSKLDGTVIYCDVGIAPQYGGHIAWLEIIEGQFYDCRPDKRRTLVVQQPLPAELAVQ